MYYLCCLFVFFIAFYSGVVILVLLQCKQAKSSKHEVMWCYFTGQFGGVIQHHQLWHTVLILLYADGFSILWSPGEGVSYNSYQHALGQQVNRVTRISYFIIIIHHHILSTQRSVLCIPMAQVSIWSLDVFSQPHQMCVMDLVPLTWI